MDAVRVCGDKKYIVWEPFLTSCWGGVRHR